MPGFIERMRQRRAAGQQSKPSTPPPTPTPPRAPWVWRPLTIPNIVLEAEAEEVLVDMRMSEEEQVAELGTTLKGAVEASDGMWETTSAEVTVAELGAMAYNELRAFLKENDLSAKGKKAELLARATTFAEGEPIE